ncbi:zinc transporter 9-like [Centruroides sculpturatus]|uniref:zinc transporter 9-like n=1 Tax=Centruroides sculpturatus TaxID=218467 RepID=UPI000C6E151F|nr:zinc transporter 9-like [Centruroides sculpturatus]
MLKTLQISIRKMKLHTECKRYSSLITGTEKLQCYCLLQFSRTYKVFPRKKLDVTKIFTERNFITPLRAMNEYLLKPTDLEELRKIQRRSPYEESPPINVYLRKDVELKAIEVWGSMEALQRELKKKRELELKNKREAILRGSGRVVMTAVMINGANFAFKLITWLYTGSHSMFAEAIHSLADTCNQIILAFGIRKSIQRPDVDHPYGYHNMRYVASLISGVGIFCFGTGISIYHGIMGIFFPEVIESLYWRNGANFAFKLITWLYTGSHSMFAEAIHSLADTCNQIILAFGIRKSIQRPDVDHPYGYHNMRYVASLISGVGIFCFGTGISIYHGIMGIFFPEVIESLYWAFFILGGSLISEGGTLSKYIRSSTEEILVSSRRLPKHYFMNKTCITIPVHLLSLLLILHCYFITVLRSRDPSLNVVLLEDLAAVIGVLIAGSCMGLTSYMGNPIYDAAGSLLVGGLLGTVASFIIYTNIAALVGRSIPADTMLQINKELENDVMIRALHDVKATDMGNNFVRYKAEVDFDGRELSRSYLDSQDLEMLLNEMQKVKTIEEVEAFMLRHGENIVDMLGGEVDRIEKGLKKRHPEVRHVDLEVL